MKIFFQRLIGIIKPHKHSIYLKCRECESWGISPPDDFECECGSLDTIEYYPTRVSKNTKSPNMANRNV